ncbi:PAAR domain-containing protein [bacterium]|nr:PAAR domain-containing protein [bacterium]
MTRPIARLGSPSDHGGTIVTASTDVFGERIGVARMGDVHACPVPGHGSTAVVTCDPKTFANGRGVARVGDSVGCGALITAGSPTTGGTP